MGGELGLFILEKRWLGGVSSMCVNPSWGSKEDRARLSSVVPRDRTRGSGHKLKYSKLNERKHVFTVRVVEHRQRLPKEVMESPSLETFRTCLGAVLGSQLQLALL